MVGYIALATMDHEGVRQVTQPSVVHATDAQAADAARAFLGSHEGRHWDGFLVWEVSYPDPPLPVPAPDGWKIATEDEGQLFLSPA